MNFVRDSAQKSRKIVRGRMIESYFSPKRANVFQTPAFHSIIEEITRFAASRFDEAQQRLEHGQSSIIRQNGASCFHSRRKRIFHARGSHGTRV